MGEPRREDEQEKVERPRHAKAMEKYKPQMDQAAKDIHTEMERIGNIPEARDTVMEG